MSEPKQTGNEPGGTEDQIQEYGMTDLEDPVREHRIHLMTIIGEIEGHDVLPNTSKSTKYEHVLPKLAEVEENQDVDGLLLLLNTMGGDVESGLAIAEMIASMSKPSVSLVLGGSHSIGVPLAVSTDYSFIVPTGTMVIHPVRLNGLTIGAPQTYEYFQQIQDRILDFVSSLTPVSAYRHRSIRLPLMPSPVPRASGAHNCWSCRKHNVKAFHGFIQIGSYILIGNGKRANTTDGMSGEFDHFIGGKHFCFRVKLSLILGIIDFGIPTGHDQNRAVIHLKG